MEVFMILFVICLFFGLFLYWVATDHSVAADINNAKTVERIAELINGTMWHFTDPLGEDSDYPPFWYKCSFQDGKVSTWVAKPAEGEWKALETVEYKIEEHRYADTGEKYICVTWVALHLVENEAYGFSLMGADVPKSVYVTTIATDKKGQKYYSFAKLGDSNPWN